MGEGGGTREGGKPKCFLLVSSLYRVGRSNTMRENNRNGGRRFTDFLRAPTLAQKNDFWANAKRPMGAGGGSHSPSRRTWGKKQNTHN